MKQTPNNLIFPKDLPENCPPQDAFQPNGKYYRFIKSKPPTNDCFLRWCDESNNQGKKKSCRHCGVSFYSHLDEAKRVFKFFERRLKINATPGIAEVTLKPRDGVIKQTGSNVYHYDLWPYVQTNLVPCSIVVK